MRRKILAVVLVLAGVLPACAQDECAFQAPRNLEVAAAGVETLEVHARAGELTIRGEAGLDQVRASGTACASRQGDLEDIRLVQRREGKRLVVAVEIPEQDGLFNGQRRLDLELRVPSRLSLNVTDSSGAARIEHVAALRMRDSSGELRISDVRGAVRVEDSSGAIDVRDVGSLHIPDDSSGEIRASRVRGDAVIDNDGSGSIELRDIGGDARIGRDGSGSIAVEDVAGGFTVERDGSGGIQHDGVRGEVRIPAR